MNFTTKIPISKYQFPIDYNSKIISLGSCFAENMAEKLDYFKFQNVVNSFGIIFNPVSIERIVERMVNQESFTENDIFCHNNLWHCFEIHSQLSHPDKDIFLKNLNQILKKSRNQIVEISHCIITYGTSWVYNRKDLNKVVANCHKIPQNQFNKEILSVETIEKSIENTIHLIQEINPKCTFIFTISPVRHIKDGFVENQRSKAHLITALHSVSSQSLSSHYFPSYEIMMDELRDYRFYAEDMLHPSNTAIDYIWNVFYQNYILETEWDIMKEVEAVQKSLLHKPFNAESDLYIDFLKKLNEKISKLQKHASHFQF